MQSTLNFLILLHISRLCHSAPGWLDDDDLFASSISSQLDANVGNLQPFSSLDDIYDFNLESFDGLNLGETDSDSNMFPPFDESSQDLQELDPYQEIFAGGEHACSSNDLLPPSRLRPRIDWCDQKPDPAILDLKIPTLDNLPRKKLPSPSPLNPPSWQPLDGILFDRPEIENPEVCPKSYRGWYYIPVCGIRLGDQGRYAPTALNNLRGWTVTDATICECISLTEFARVYKHKMNQN